MNSLSWPKQTERLRPTIAAVIVLILGFAAAVVGGTATHAAGATEFNDVPTDAQFYLEISWLSDQRITTGYSDGGFHPKESVSREAFAAFLYRLAAKPAVSLPHSSPFSDVKRTDQFYKEIVWLSKEGITTGWADGTFRPKDKITREAIAAFLYRYAGSPYFKVPRTSAFTDMTPRSKFFKEVLWLLKQGITTGYADKTFRPKTNVSREATAAFFYRGNTTLRRDGTYQVGSDIAPGKYVAIPRPGETCEWYRISRTGVQVGLDVLDSGRTAVEISPADKAFNTVGCSGWTPLRKVSPSATKFGDGTNAVGYHMKSGRYSTTSGPNCAVTHFSSLGGSHLNVISSHVGTGGPSSYLLKSGEALTARHCGNWTRIGS